jgi:hypothetical protein
MLDPNVLEYFLTACMYLENAGMPAIYLVGVDIAEVGRVLAADAAPDAAFASASLLHDVCCCSLPAMLAVFLAVAMVPAMAWSGLICRL